MISIYDSIIQFFSDVSDFFTNLFDFFKALILQIFIDFWTFVKDIFFWIFEQIFIFIEFILETLSVYTPDFPDISSYWSALGPDVSNILGLIGLGEALSIILSALTIRLIMQLIPFTRLGS